jgi:membrane-associated phospholipid phosphatase
MIVKESRPQVLFPQIRLLFKPFSLWKSFPSDHAALAFLICFMGAALQVPWSWNLIPLALWVGWGRVYAGVHYPLDILGGMVTAGIVTMLFRAIVKV